MFICFVLSCFCVEQAKIEVRVNPSSFYMLNSDDNAHHNDDAVASTVITVTAEVGSSQHALVFECAVAKHSYTLRKKLL